MVSWEDFNQKEVRKTQPVRILLKNEFYKCIGWIILEVTYGNRIYRIWGRTNITDIGKNTCITGIFIFLERNIYHDALLVSFNSTPPPMNYKMRGSNNILSHYHHGVDPKIGNFGCSVLWIPCAFPACIAKLDK